MHEYHEYCKILKKELCNEFERFECDRSEQTLCGIKMILECLTDLQELEAGGFIRDYMGDHDGWHEIDYRGIYNSVDPNRAMKEGMDRNRTEHGRYRENEPEEDQRKRHQEYGYLPVPRYDPMRTVYNMVSPTKHKKEKEKLTDEEKQEWVDNLQNADGTVGPTFSKEQAASIAKKVGAKYDGYNEMDFYLVLNMVYSDMCEALSKAGANADSPTTYGYIALSWLEDADSYKPEEHLARYYEHIVKH